MSILCLCHACCILCYTRKDGLCKKQKIADTENATLNAGLNTMYEITCQQYYLFFACRNIQPHEAIKGIAIKSILNAFLIKIMPRNKFHY